MTQSVSEYDLKKKTAKLGDIILDKESKNGNKYTALILSNGEWIFVWDTDWRKHIKQFSTLYQENKVDIYFRDKSDDENDSFLNMEAITPADPEKADKILDKISQTQKN